MGLIFWVLVGIVTLVLLARGRPSLLPFSLGAAFVLVVAWVFGFLAGPVGALVTLVGAGALLVFNLAPLRRRLVSLPLLRYVRAVLPPMSDTERTAIEAGSVWWEA